ncbi:9927_t:CDS:1, partial [Scutellospora calospora]
IMEPSTSDTTDNQQVLYRKKSGRPKAAAWVYFTKGSATDKYGQSWFQK